jgi:hypothetical protein
MLRQQIEEGFDNIGEVDPEIRGIVARNWPHLLSKLPPEEDRPRRWKPQQPARSQKGTDRRLRRPTSAGIDVHVKVPKGLSHLAWHHGAARHWPDGCGASRRIDMRRVGGGMALKGGQGAQA